MSILRVALLQMVAARNDQDANLARGVDFCRRAKAAGADIALFPEMWNIGYTPYEGCPEDYAQIGKETDEQIRAKAEWQAQAISQDDRFVNCYRELAVELDMAIAITYLEAWPSAPRNTVSLIDHRGELALTYAKVHTCDFGMEAACTPGDSFPVCCLSTASGPVQVGAMICFDREFPESARLLMLNGAEIILVPNACRMELNRITQLRARAFENMVGVALANYAVPEANGHSIAFDGMAFDEQGHSRDTLLVEAGERAGVYIASFDLDSLRAYRTREVWGNAFRRPERYVQLVDTKIEDPFVRVNARGERYNSSERTPRDAKG